MSDEINALIEAIIASGKKQGMNKGDIAMRAGMQNNKFGRIMNADPRISTLVRLGHAVGLKLVFEVEDEDLSSIMNREVF